MERQQVPESTYSVSSNGNGSSSMDLIGQFQYAMVQWLEVQKSQMQVNQHFLDTQQAVMLACLQGAPSPPAIQGPRRLAQLVPSGSPKAQPQLRVPPAPVVPAGSSLGTMTQTEAAPASPAPNPARQTESPASSAGVSPAQPAPVSAPAPSAAPPPEVQEKPAAVSAPAQTVAEPAPEPVSEDAPAAPPAEPATEQAANSSGAPSLEAFREDLLEAIADRTGYPIDMLDEKLELEAGLGIDSIKTIEIFGMLTEYHAYLPGASEDQEESLAAFAQLRTIRDILDTYQANLSENRQNSNGESPRPDGEETKTASSEVERATLEAVEVTGDPADHQKKNSLATTSS